MKFCFAPRFTPSRKGTNFDGFPANDSTRPCKKFCEKRSQPEGHLFGTSALPMARKGISKKHIRFIKKTACLAHMAAQPSSNAFKKNVVRFSAHHVKRNAETKHTSLRHVEAFVRMQSGFQHLA